MLTPKLFCNECNLRTEIPKLIASKVTGNESLSLLVARYEQMRQGYNCSYEEWRTIFTPVLKPFKRYEDTTAVVIPIFDAKFREDFDILGLGAIGLDLPTWFNITSNNTRIMIIAQDPLRNNHWYGDCHDLIISSPFGLHDAVHRAKGNGGKMANLLIQRLIEYGYGVYLTDANKYFVYDRKTSMLYSKRRLNDYVDILQQELNLVKPSICVCLGNKSKQVLEKCLTKVKVIVLPHLSGTARGAIIKKFPILKEKKSTAENIASMYVSEIVKTLEL